MSCAFKPWEENPKVCANCKSLTCPGKVDLNMEFALAKTFRKAIVKAFPGVAANVPKMLIVKAKGKGNGDYQCNNAMALCKQLKGLPQPVSMTPQQVASEICANVDKASGLVEEAVPNQMGYINVSVGKTYAEAAVARLVRDGIQPPEVEKQRVLVDFSSPNIAKIMHVGHLRSTIIGDSLCRIFEFCGHEVLRTNHVGDWGTQFGMLIAHLKSICPNFLESPPDVADLSAFYKAAKKRFDDDPEFRKVSHQEVVALQGGDEQNLAAWRLICDISRKEFARVYKQLDVWAEEKGESFYNPIIPDVLDKVSKLGLTEVVEGATLMSAADWKTLGKEAKDADVAAAVRFALVKNKGQEKVNPVLLEAAKKIGAAKEEDGTLMLQCGKKFVAIDKAGHEEFDKFVKSCQPVLKYPFAPEIQAELEKLGTVKDGKIKVPAFTIPLIVKKSDGGFSYDTTDLAAVWYRTQVQKAHRVICITDLGQEKHFHMIFRAAKDAGWHIHENGQEIRFDHAGFGVVLGEDKKRLRTRSGDTVNLQDLLDQGVAKAKAVAQERQAEKEARFKELKEKGELREEFTPFTEAELDEIAETVGIGAIKYVDLRQNRLSDYIYDGEKMVSLNGNTVMMMLYNYVRCRSMARKAGLNEMADVQKAEVRLDLPCEKALALELLRLPVVLNTCMDTLMLHYLTDYLYQLTNVFGDCYNNKEWKVVGHELQSSRMLLCHATAMTIKKGLELLGIKTVERL